MVWQGCALWRCRPAGDVGAERTRTCAEVPQPEGRRCPAGARVRGHHGRSPVGRLGLRQFLPRWPLTRVQKSALADEDPAATAPARGQRGGAPWRLAAVHTRVSVCMCVCTRVHVLGTPRGKSCGTPGKDPNSLLKAPLPHG